jgi:hypothetical protein
LQLAWLPTTARRRTVASDKAYDTKGFVAGVRELGFTPRERDGLAGDRSHFVRTLGLLA